MKKRKKKKKNTFPALLPGRVKYAPMGNKTPRAGLETFPRRPTTSSTAGRRARLKEKTAVSRRGLNALERSWGSWRNFVCEGINLNLLYQGEIWQRLGRRRSESAGNSQPSTAFKCRWIPSLLVIDFLLTTIKSINQNVIYMALSMHYECISCLGMLHRKCDTHQGTEEPWGKPPVGSKFTLSPSVRRLPMRKHWS